MERQPVARIVYAFALLLRNGPKATHAMPNAMKDTESPGVVILGGAHGSLALARSLGAKGVPVWLVSNDNPLPGWSRHFRKVFAWPGPDADEAASFITGLAVREGFYGALLVPAGDAEVSFASRAKAALAPALDVVLTPWERLERVVEKPLLYRLCAELELGCPTTWPSRNLVAGDLSALRFPVILKPNMGGGKGALARAKVMRIDEPKAFAAAFNEACAEIGVDNVVVQELVPGGGECQFSYAALWFEGAPIAEYTARRTRQYPVDFGYTSTFVEVVDEPEVAIASRRLLASIGHHGLVEIEFKRDPRDGSLRVLDVNPRPWSWFGLSAAAGVDLGAMLWDKANGATPGPAIAETGASWMYLVRDFVSAAVLARRGPSSLPDWFASFGKVRAWACFSVGDPVPGLIDIPLTLWRVVSRRLLAPLLAGLGGPKVEENA